MARHETGAKPRVASQQYAIRCPMRIHDQTFPVDLMKLPLLEFDLILGIDWLTEHDASLRCKTIRLKLIAIDGTKLVMTSERSHQTRIISVLKAQRIIDCGCEAFLAHVVDTRILAPTLGDIRTVRDFFDVFPEELSGLPPERALVSDT
ncbi:uncharacterized protein LOC120151813 [Hibiscus syriacus]|uniref:uncharacterized protein LOC120151813 n=1 Tax=Hibiscus syriacus TaxID=106335 RepID=UPI0019216C25|nr:uncharacterized protein LOC120151813 [Hibiscus syriacus]